MRGNRHGAPIAVALRRSIPAHAGEPSAKFGSKGIYRVYPRACRGTHCLKVRRQSDAGLSPRMRGNRRYHVRRNWCRGSIPAHAGEPLHAHHRRDLARVYPRACGGTPSGPFLTMFTQGLSPRMRGNRRHGARGTQYKGSIPAHAGEPRGLKRWSKTTGVYPRACGGTGLNAKTAFFAAGLSPRMRGNRGPSDVVCGVVGSIPAHAGEPTKAP